MRVIEAFADVWCPFTHAGLRAVANRRRELGHDEVSLWIRAWPLELVNGEPLRGDVVAHEISALRAQVAPDLFAGFDEARFPKTSLPALTLASVAYRRDARTGERVSMMLRDALFEEGRDISDPDVLAAIAGAHDLDLPASVDLAAIRADWEEGQRRGVKGSPHFFCGDLNAFCPSLAIAKDDDGDVRIHADPAALNEFITGCFASLG